MAPRVALVFAVLLAVLPVAAREKNTFAVQSATAVCARAHAALKAGDLAQASALYEEALRLVPEFPDAHMGLGHIAMARREFAGALGHFTIARDRLVVLHADGYARERRAYDDAQVLIPKLEDEIAGLQRLPGGGAGAMDLQNLQQQIDALRRIHQPTRNAPAPLPAEVFFYRGNALFRLERLDEALADWRECARLDPSFGAVQNNIALAEWSLGHVEAARDALAEARRLGAPVNPEFAAKVEARAKPAGGVGTKPITN